MNAQCNYSKLNIYIIDTVLQHDELDRKRFDTQKCTH